MNSRSPVNRRGRRNIDPSALAKLRRLPAYLVDPSVSLLKKVAILIGVVYIVSPFDVVSDFLPIIGWLDDLGILGLMYFFMMRELSGYAGKRHKQAPETLSAGN